MLLRESPEEFILALERAWIRNFGPMKTLQVDDHRSWRQGERWSCTWLIRKREM